MVYWYDLALETGGLMEMSDRKLIQRLIVEAPDLREAKRLWAAGTGTDRLDDWNPGQQTYWGWGIVVTDTNDPNVEKADLTKYM